LARFRLCKRHWSDAKMAVLQAFLKKATTGIEPV
jgi:hypothetical protein